uniref:Selenoprotein P N-terminal domain-containing protein n=1 Tax=Parascaris univalens TaxID=6257 RepID=A0A914ZFI4_PARUN
LLVTPLALLTLSFQSAQALPPICDQTIKWTINERNIVEESKGFILLAVFMPLQGNNVNAQLMKLEAVGETIREVRVVVIAPQKEDSRLLDRYREKFPQMTFEIESAHENVRRKLGAADYDHFIYDRCGRIANVIRHPRSDVTRFEDTVKALKAAINYAHCGWCNYNLRLTPTPAFVAPQITAYLLPSSVKGASDRGSINQHHPHTFSTKRPEISYTQSTPQYVDSQQDRKNLDERHRVDLENAQAERLRESSHRTHLNTATFNGRTTSTQSVQKSDRRQGVWRPGSQMLARKRPQSSAKSQEGRSSDGFESSAEEAGRTRPDAIRSRQNNEEFVHSRRTQEFRQEEQKREQERREQEEEKLEQERRQQEESDRQRHESDRLQREYETRNEQYERQRNRQTKLQQQQQQRQQKQQRQRQQQQQQQYARVQPHHQHTTLKPFASDRRNDRHDEPSVEEYDTMSSPEPIAVTENNFGISEHTQPLYGSDENDDYVDYGDSHFGFSTDAPIRTQIPPTPSPSLWPTPFTFVDNIPCGAFTDDVCYHQIKKSGKENLSKCCNKGVYLTDVCVPGRCSNVTTRLCCMQKFIQAKYMCCENSTNSLSATGDTFSRCCYEHFVGKADSCCPLLLAKYHWLSTSELCLPNVRADLSAVRIEAELGESKKVSVDLGEDRSWDYKCGHSGSAPQFIYVPDEDSTDSEEKSDDG